MSDADDVRYILLETIPVQESKSNLRTSMLVCVET